MVAASSVDPVPSVDSETPSLPPEENRVMAGILADRWALKQRTKAKALQWEHNSCLFYKSELQEGEQLRRRHLEEKEKKKAEQEKPVRKLPAQSQGSRSGAAQYPCGSSTDGYTNGDYCQVQGLPTASVHHSDFASAQPTSQWPHDPAAAEQRAVDMHNKAIDAYRQQVQINLSRQQQQRHPVPAGFQQNLGHFIDSSHKQQQLYQQQTGPGPPPLPSLEMMQAGLQPTPTVYNQQQQRQTQSNGAVNPFDQFFLPDCPEFSPDMVSCFLGNDSSFLESGLGTLNNSDLDQLLQPTNSGYGVVVSSTCGGEFKPDCTPLKLTIAPTPSSTSRQEPTNQLLTPQGDSLPDILSEPPSAQRGLMSGQNGATSLRITPPTSSTSSVASASGGCSAMLLEQQQHRLGNSVNNGLGGAQLLNSRERLPPGSIPAMNGFDGMPRGQKEHLGGKLPFRHGNAHNMLLQHAPGPPGSPWGHLRTTPYAIPHGMPGHFPQDGKPMACYPYPPGMTQHLPAMMRGASPNVDSVGMQQSHHANNGLHPPLRRPPSYQGLVVPLNGVAGMQPAQQVQQQGPLASRQPPNPPPSYQWPPVTQNARLPPPPQLTPAPPQHFAAFRSAGPPTNQQQAVASAQQRGLQVPPSLVGQVANLQQQQPYMQATTQSQPYLGQYGGQQGPSFS